MLGSNRLAARVSLRGPVLVAVIAATAIPLELRPHLDPTFTHSLQVFDVASNIIGYIPVGMVLWGLSPRWAVVLAGAMTVGAETAQMTMVYREPSFVDMGCNLCGAIVGIAISMHWQFHSWRLRLGPATGVAAALLGVALFCAVWAMSGDPLSPRGATTAGALEGHWKLDESSGRVALDSSGQHRNGTFRHEPTRVAGMIGGAVLFNGAENALDLGHSTAFRLVGSMTVSAWIRPTANPVDDAAIVSNFTHDFVYALGYQLDTTVDRGPRTIGFKLADMCGKVMARYGATPVPLNQWSHVAGVYDARARTMNVYLNGKPDDGFQLGSVSSRHRSSRGSVSIAKRNDFKGFEFVGNIDDVRLYSRTLSAAEIVAAMQGGIVDQQAMDTGTSPIVESAQPEAAETECGWSSEREDARLPGVVATLGMLFSVAGLSLWPSIPRSVGLVISVGVGLLLVPVTASTLPASKLWMFPLISAAGGASVIWSEYRANSSIM